jgi:hypothetical protein
MSNVLVSIDGWEPDEPDAFDDNVYMQADMALRDALRRWVEVGGGPENLTDLLEEVLSEEDE